MITTQLEQFSHTPSDITLCQQLGRWWASKTAGAVSAADQLVFCEPTASTPANLYACAMPDKRFRRTIGGAVSITPTTAPPDDTGVTRSIGIAFEARGRTAARCIAMLRQIRSWLMPNERSIQMVRDSATYLGQQIGNVPGFPAAGLAIGASLDLWAIVGVDPLQSITVVFQGTPGNATEDGEALATMTLSIRCYPVRVRGAVEAFSALYTPPGGNVSLDRGTIQVVDLNPDNRITCISNDPEGTDHLTCAGRTIWDMVALVDALSGWSIPSTAAFDLSALPANDLITMAGPVTAYVGAGGTGPVKLTVVPQTIDSNLA